MNRATASGCHDAIEHFEEALAADPSLARAHAGIANAYWWLSSYGGVRPELGFARARAAAERALSLDRSRADAYLALGQVQFLYQWDFAGADRSFQYALKLEPWNAEAHRAYGHFLKMMGRREDALQAQRQAVRLDPLSLRAHMALADTLFCSGSLAEALGELDQIAEFDPGFPVHHLRARIALARGEPGEALDAVQREPIKWRRSYISAIAYHRLEAFDLSRAELGKLIENYGDAAAFQIALVYGQTGDKDQAFHWLERAFDLRDPGMVELEVDPELEPLRPDERFRQLALRVGFSARNRVAAGAA